jgi:hypothetical protein
VDPLHRRGGGAGKKLARLAGRLAAHEPPQLPPDDDDSPVARAVRASVADQPVDVEYLWPDNVRTWECWMSVQTQWRAGMAGATGLDYAGVRSALAIQGVRGAELREVFAGIQAAELATLSAWSAKRAEREARSQREGRANG